MNSEALVGHGTSGPSGVRQRTSGKCVAEIHEPNRGARLWFGTFKTSCEGALTYDVALLGLAKFSQSNPPTCFKINGNLSSSCCPRTHLTMEVSRLLKHLVGTRLYLCGLCLLSTNV
ncbi:basic helix-loop-helix protein [Trifolium repens]|nr:basic helix-loop-helix protein [Trifolium repens]